MKGHRKINHDTVGIFFSFVHGILNTRRRIWFPFQHLVHSSAVINEPNSAILFRYDV